MEARGFGELPRFSLLGSGRTGTIVYVEGARSLEFGWEMSGSADYDILLTPLDLRQWATPHDEPIAVSTQLEILSSLRDWLSTKRIRSDIERPPFDSSDRPCVSAGCRNHALSGVVFCADHFDLRLLVH